MHYAMSSPESLMIKGLKELALPFTQGQVRLFMAYLTELKKWNKAYNLTSLKTDEDIIIKHFLDSLLYLKALPHGNISVVDVGSGAGFPGIPIKIMRPEIVMYLLEPSRKKTNFLRNIIKVLGLEAIEIMERRIENVEPLAADVAVTRALFDIKEFSEKARPLVKRGGRLILSKGPKVHEELKTIKNKGIACEILILKLPLTDIVRSMVITGQVALDIIGEQGHHQLTHDEMPQNFTICINAECRLRKTGCLGFEGCPGFKAKANSGKEGHWAKGQR
ncbi:MAG TPA: 16S rRNA (guanine(527)-N(7))-methyltransferase RsmG [Nitrospiraceae bacterium]|nr:16S rRNA (guanine(527)-N(7))-methyltransferase RsmG [Nitrospiraceae bacterium]